jgi:RNAse (barnase) inhibitor barstar
MTKQVVEIDGVRFDDLEGFYDEVSDHLIPGLRWGRNLDAFKDILTWREEAYILRWLNSDHSRKVLGQTVFDKLVEIIRLHRLDTDPIVELELK